MSFDNFYLTTWEQENKSESKKEPQIPRLNSFKDTLNLFSFEYNLLPKLLTDYYDYMDQAWGSNCQLKPNLNGTQMSLEPIKKPFRNLSIIEVVETGYFLS